MNFKKHIFVATPITDAMKKYTLFLLCMVAMSAMRAQSFAHYFADKTLRVDYIFTGNADKQEICLDELSSLPAGQEESTTWPSFRYKETDKS